MTITSPRGKVVDFTKAYYDVGLQALYNVETSDNQFDGSELFAFLRPFDTNLWLLALASIIVVSVGVAITGRLSPYDWYQNPPDHLPLWEARFQMTFFNSVWQSLTAALQQGMQLNIKSYIVFPSITITYVHLYRCRNSATINIWKNFNGRMVACMHNTC